MIILIPSFNKEHKEELEQDLLYLINDNKIDEDVRETAKECYNECFENLI